MQRQSSREKWSSSPNAQHAGWLIFKNLHLYLSIPWKTNWQKGHIKNAIILVPKFLSQAVLDILAIPKSDLDDFMEDDQSQGPVSSSDPMLSSPAPSTLSSSPSSFYSSDENLSPESMDHLIV